VCGDVSILPSEAGRHVVLAQSDVKGKWIALSQDLYPIQVTVAGESPQLAWFEAPPGVYAVGFIPLDDSQPIVKRVELGEPGPPPPPPPEIDVSLKVKSPILEGDYGIGIAEHTGDGTHAIILSSDSQRLTVPKVVDSPPGSFKAVAPDNEVADGPVTARIRAMLGNKSARADVLVEDDDEPPGPNIPDDEFGNVGRHAYDVAMEKLNAAGKAVAKKVGENYTTAADRVDNGKLPTIESAAEWITSANEAVWGANGVRQQYQAWSKEVAKRWNEHDVDEDKWKVARFFRAVGAGLNAVE
jgi:hypothetical protein